MKKLLVLSSALLVFSASLASAQINLSWNNCLGVGTAAANKNYACDGSLAGTPAFKLVMSFNNVIDMSAFVAVQAVIDVQTSNAVLPDFWRLGTGECRGGALLFPGGLTGTGTGAAGTCQDIWSDVGTGGGYDYASGFGGPGRARLRMSFARSEPRPLAYGTGSLAGVIFIDPIGDSPDQSPFCAGCNVPGCLVLNSIEVLQVANTPPTDLYQMTQPGTRNYVTWQGGDPNCVGATPTNNKTWGSVKALYR